MKKLIRFLSVMMFVFSGTALAHVQLKESAPSDDTILTDSPQVLSLTFSSDVRIVRASLSNQQGKKIDFGFKPSMQSDNHFSWQLPKLVAEDYTVEIIFFGTDGHKMKESLSFTVS
ncbi:copper resistance protein CopC [Lacimicrobium sp. SS2-24]|uniref:copper resistance CopC family protein n=1 Tax=Lacimicrobium sp. SS2-24 TaxID=2005569 RepID=UPI000B4C0815|nr:copper resistance protein CopC [Lacimicrobium sp. SS2-24]